MKSKWSVWYQLVGKETGLGWNDERTNVAASDEWWEKKILEDPRASQFQKKGLKLTDKLTFLFAPGSATGEYAWAPSSNTLPHDLEKLDSTEGSGDSEDPNIGASIDPDFESEIGVSAGASFGFGNFTLNTSGGSSLSGMKRKRGESKATKMDKQTQQKKLNAYLDRICGAVESRTSSVQVDKIDNINDPYSIINVIKEVKKLRGMELGSQLLAQSCHILKDLATRQMFVALEDEESRLQFLMYEINQGKS